MILSNTIFEISQSPAKYNEMGFIYTQHLDFPECSGDYGNMVLMCNRCCNHLSIYQDTQHNGSYSIVGSIVNCKLAQESELMNHLKIKRVYCSVCLSLLGFKAEQISVEKPEIVSNDISSVEYKIFRNNLVDIENSINHKRYSEKYNTLLEIYEDIIGKYCFSLKLSSPIPIN